MKWMDGWKTMVAGLLLAGSVSIFANTYYLQSTGNAPWPYDPYGGTQPISVVDEAQHIYLVEDVGESLAMRGMSAMSLDFPLPGGGGTNGGYIEYTNTYTVDTNGLWLSVEGAGQFQLHNATNEVYAVLSKTNLSEASWKIEGDLWPTNGEAMPFTLSTVSESLFVWAKDWTGVDSDSDGLPDAWEWGYFASLDFSGTNVDANGNTFLYDYQNNLDPNILRFSLKATSRYVSSGLSSLQVKVGAGTPFYYTVSVDDTNFMAATNWLPYTSASLVIPLGSTEGWHGVWVGLKGLAPGSTPVWQWKRLKWDTTPPKIAITNAATVDVPLLQLQGYSDEALSRITYDLTNALGLVTNEAVGVDSRRDGATNAFHAFDVELTNGINVLTLHAVDMAGNETTTNFTFTLDYSSKTNPPVFQVTWPPAGEAVCGNSLTLRGQAVDPTVVIMAQMVDTNGWTNTFAGVVERDGRFWLEHLPLNAGTNAVAMTVQDAAGNVNTTNLWIVRSAMTLAMNPPDAGQLWQPMLNVSGVVSDATATVLVNGVAATNHGNGTWSAENVPVSPGGVAVFDLNATPLGGADPVATTNTDKPPRVYVESYRLGTEDASAQTDWESDSPSPIGNLYVHYKEDFHYDWQWTEGQGGQGAYTHKDYLDAAGDALHDSLLVITYNWPSNSVTGISHAHREFLESEDDWESWDSTNSAVPVPAIPLEYCQASLFYRSTFDGTLYAGMRQAQTQIRLATGGKALSKRKNLFGITVTATPHAYNVQGYFYDLFFTQPDPDPIAIADVEVLGKHPDTNGVLYVLLPDNDDQDITPDAPDADYYTFDVQPQKYHCYFEVFVEQAYAGSTYYSVTETEGHAFWQFKTDAPSEALQYISTNLTVFLNHSWGFYPHGAWCGLPGILENDDSHSKDVKRIFNIGLPDLIKGLQFIREINNTPPEYCLAVTGYSCVGAAREAGSKAGITLPTDWTPQNFGVSLVLTFPGPLEDDTIHDSK